MKVLITGGAGYIGATIASACLENGITPVILDDLSSGAPSSLHGRIFYRGDVADSTLVDFIFERHQPIHAIHCAGMTSVPQSFHASLQYFETNVAKSTQLVVNLVRNGCRHLIYSSSAAVYGSVDDFFVDEQATPDPCSPYARTKVLMEEILQGAVRDCGLNAISLRYFNPIGVDPQMRTGRDSSSPRQVVDELIDADRLRRPFRVTGARWPTVDGTGVRDYVHVWDLALAHIAALHRLAQTSDGQGRFDVINLGTGVPTTVLQLLDSFRHLTGRSVHLEYEDPRPGDIAGVVNRSSRARDLLGWVPRRTLEDALADTIAWHDRHGGLRAGTSSEMDG